MPTHHNKLVRDNIPDIIASSGRRCATEELGPQAYRQALLEKLVEEAHEAATATSGAALLAELADLREVIAAAVAAFGLTEAALATEQDRRRSERGAFTRRIRLLWAD